uniref:Uncharacterized protein n=1 Tax=Euplotes crassus TaxID=5936 RepID=A0A7S3KRM4_EUPCR|mmetsp:Transcript_37509/g.37058  ORF Transcript_37509/g.37058 Transcript_37509/m.37058 type:complete len:135 (+) Transcript_37509:68-472(+)
MEENTQVTLAYYFRKRQKKMIEKHKALRKKQKEKEKRDLLLIEAKNKQVCQSYMKQNDPKAGKLLSNRFQAQNLRRISVTKNMIRGLKSPGLAPFEPKSPDPNSNFKARIPPERFSVIGKKDKVQRNLNALEVK